MTSYLILLIILIGLIGCNSPHSQAPSSEVPPVSGNTSVQIEKKPKKTEQIELEIPPRREGDEFTRATEVYGPAYVLEGNYFSDLKIVPWSAPWYPFAEDYLYKGDSSPLHKYDLYAAASRKMSTQAANFEKRLHTETDFVPWAGRCNSWAIASVMEPEPFLRKPVELNGIPFTTGDLKALLVMSYDRIEGITQFGQRNNGDEKSVAEDIYPDQFHQVVWKEMFEKRRPLIMDKDLGIEVWNVPVYKAELTLLHDKTNLSLMHVTAALVGAAPLDPGIDPNISSRKNVIYSYTYDLYGYPQPDGTLKVAYGVWTGDSIKSHPDFLWTLPEKKERKSLNSEIQVEIVDEIIRKAHASIAY